MATPSGEGNTIQHNSLVEDVSPNRPSDGEDLSRKSRCLEPLTFDLGTAKEEKSATLPEKCPVGSPVVVSNANLGLMKCLFCDEHFNGAVQFKDDFLRHLLHQHKFVIGDFKTVPDFRSYIEYWRTRFGDGPKTDFCSVIRTNTGQNDTEASEDYYLLCDALEEDKTVREKLQIAKLLEVLEQQQRERKEQNFDCGCLFCRDHFKTNRADVINHMQRSHNFNIGHPDNLVYTDELLQVLQEKLDNLICFYCEKQFVDRHSLKEHIRKKLHRQINPRDKKYDKYYVINYLEIGKTWEDIHSQDDCELPNQVRNADSEWADWWEEEEPAVCLFCAETETPSVVLQHMTHAHNFNLLEESSRTHLTFYQQVKLVNYIRRQVHQNTCPNCEASHASREELLAHWLETDHVSSAPANQLWDQPEYFFPTFENDRLLCCLDEAHNADVTITSDTDDVTDVMAAASLEDVQDVVVIPEELDLEEAFSRKDAIMQMISANPDPGQHNAHYRVQRAT